MSELDFQNLDKCVDLIGKEIYAFESVYAGHPEYNLEKYRSVSEPTIAFLARDEGWEDDGR